VRLLVISSEFPPGPGGIGTHAFQIVLHLRKLGWEISVITAQDYASTLEVNKFNELQPFSIIRFPSARFPVLKAVLRLKLISAYIKQWKPTILMATGGRAVWLAALINEMHLLPSIAMGHGTEFGVRAFWKRRLNCWSFRKVSAVICVSEYTRQQVLLAGIKPKRVWVIPNGGDSTQFKTWSLENIEGFRKRSNLGGMTIVVTVGNVTNRKGQDIVIKALPLILKEVPDTHYLVIGLPTRRDEFENIARQLGVADHVHFLGRVDADNLVGYLNSCEVFVMTSRHAEDGDFEGYGIAVVEAALCGKPAVVSAESGLVEAIIDGITGTSVPMDDEQATAQALLSLLKDGNRRRDMGTAARDRALSEQTWAHRASQYDSLFKDLLRSLSPERGSRPSQA